ncbi:HEXXH motif domain-containing protein [Kibdelosporangium persicum]|uniref:Transcriptional regulator n=1 Tax=Kibdelosporangium persicum TaxID=2698649 RepID=A0ABX2EWK5_9PSEU|nr:HEXXH motif domain-containing protein [Kibdelosporangium persicum]NRN63431.1 Transcriptional regulator [Kibdelosporangium persicum]
MASLRDEVITHRLAPDFFAEFCSGAVSENSMRVLRTSVYSQRRAMLLAVMRLAASNPVASGFAQDLDQAYGILSDLEHSAPETLESVIMHPSTGVWLVRAVRLLLGVGQDSDAPELSYLQSLAAAAAVRAGYACTITVPVIHRTVVLPTVGHVRLPAQARDQAELRNSAELTVLHLGPDIDPISFGRSAPNSSFIPTRHHHANRRGVDLFVEIDDNTPYREFSTPEPPFPLTATESAEWAGLLERAWDELTHWHLGYAEELAVGLHTIAPAPRTRNYAGSSSNSAFGAVALSPKTSEFHLAEVLVHELQHSKLNAVLELVPLHHGGPEDWWYAPWRPDPRPLTGLLHGIYAFVSVVEFWHNQRGHITDTGLAREGDFTFAYRRAQVRRAVDSLSDAMELTEFGDHLVSAASDRLAVTEAEAVPAELADIVRLMAQDHWVTWRLQHMRPDDDYVTGLADAWRNRKPAPPHVPSRMVPFWQSTPSTTRMALLKAKAVDPERFVTLKSTARDADVAFVAGNVDAARSEYLAWIRRDPTALCAWVGLAVSSADLVTAPEVLLSLYNRLHGRPDPLDLATWLGA